MLGQAVVTIGENQWNVEVASTTAELVTGLSGRASMPAGTGMLFILPARQVATVDTSQMLFALDIIFISNSAVFSIARNIEPGHLVEEATPIDMFLEVNAGEAELVEVGDIVDVEITTTPTSGFDISSIISFAIPLAVLGFIFGMPGVFGSGSSSNPQRLGKAKTEAERKEAHLAKYGTKELPERGSGQDKYYWEISDKEIGEIIQRGKPYTTASKALSGARSYQKGRVGKDKEHSVIIRIFADSNMEEWGKTIKPVMESGMRRGIPLEIGKTPLQKAALDRLWPHSVIEIHSDGDLTVRSGDKKYIVTTEGGVFEEEGQHSIHGEPRRRLVEEYGSWAVGRAEAICPEDDVACVTRESKRLIETLRSRHGEEAMRYVTITDPGKTVFHVGDVVSIIALERENERVRKLGEREATWSA